MKSSTSTQARKRPPHARGSAEQHRRTRQARAGELAQDYVEVIDDLIAECGEARVVDIA